MVSPQRVSPRPGGLHEATLLLRDVMLARADLEKYHARLLDVNGVDYRAMGVLLGQGPVTPTQLGAELGLTASATSNVLDRLEAVGHVRRDRDPLDRRRVIVQAEPASRAKAMSTMMPLITGLDDLVRGMSPEQAEAVTTYLQHTRDALDALVTDLAHRLDEKESLDA